MGRGGRGGGGQRSSPNGGVHRLRPRGSFPHRSVCVGALVNDCQQRELQRLTRYPPPRGRHRLAPLFFFSTGLGGRAGRRDLVAKPPVTHVRAAPWQTTRRLSRMACSTRSGPSRPTGRRARPTTRTSTMRRTEVGFLVGSCYLGPGTVALSLRGGESARGCFAWESVVGSVGRDASGVGATAPMCLDLGVSCGWCLCC